MDQPTTFRHHGDHQSTETRSLVSFNNKVLKRAFARVLDAMVVVLKREAQYVLNRGEYIYIYIGS